MALLQEEMDQKAVEECTFVPNQAQLSSSQMSRAKSASRIGMGENRTIQQFLEDQKKKEEERMMKITLKMELTQMQEQKELTSTPNINKKSKLIAEKILN